MYFVWKNTTNEQNLACDREMLNGSEDLDIFGSEELQLLPKK